MKRIENNNLSKAVVMAIVIAFIGSSLLPVVGSQYQDISAESIQTNIEKSMIDTISKEEARISVLENSNDNNQLSKEEPIEGDHLSLGRGSDDPPTFYEDTGRWYNKPSTYDELITWYHNLEQNFSDYIHVWKANEMYGLGTIPDAGYDL